MKIEEKVALMGLLAAQLQDNVGNRVTHALAHGLLSVVDQNLAVDPPPTMHDLAAPAQPAELSADAGAPN